MCSHPDLMPESYRRYLVNGLRDHFDMPGTPIPDHVPWARGEKPLQEREQVPYPSRLRKHIEGRKD